MIEVTDEQMARIVDAIVREVHPERIILFGSRARGDARPDSDVDLLVVRDQPFDQAASRREEMARIRHALWEFTVPIDVVVYTREEMDEWRDSVNHLIGRSLQEGEVLYERS